MSAGATKQAQREYKLERWLVAVSDRLKQGGLAPRLLYTDKAKGDRLALVVPARAGLVEVLVHRAPHAEDEQAKAGANLVIVAESKAALEEVASAIGALHRETPRLENERRKFFHRIERMAEHLVATFELRAAHFPHDAFERLRGWLGHASPMVGVEATFRTKEHEPEATRLAAEPEANFRRRQANKYPVFFAARVAGPDGPRAAPFVPATNGFRLGFKPAVHGVAAAAGAVAVGAMSAGAIDESRRREHHEGGDDALEVAVDLADLGVDVATGGWTDCGGIDLPDCDFVDVPDCGGCDCSI
jgi:hypothetical protein